MYVLITLPILLPNATALFGKISFTQGVVKILYPFYVLFHNFEFYV